MTSSALASALAARLRRTHRGVLALAFAGVLTLAAGLVTSPMGLQHLPDNPTQQMLTGDALMSSVK